MKKIYKVIDNITFYGSNKWIKIDYKKPEWSKELEPCFRYNNHIYYLSEFMPIQKHAHKYMKEFDGYLNDSYFSGVVIKIGENSNYEEAIKAFTFIA